MQKVAEVVVEVFLVKADKAEVAQQSKNWLVDHT
jgi:hypothetical protein